MATDRIYGAYQTAGVKVDTAAKSQVDNDGTDAYAQLVAVVGGDGSTVGGTAANPVVVTVVSGGASGAATGTQTAVASAASSTTVLAANTGRRGASVYYDGAAILYLLVGTSPATASAANFTVKMGQGIYTYYEVPYGYTGIIRGFWSVAVGSANVTEWTA